MARVGIFGDTHLPHHLPDYLDWCLDIFSQWDVDTYIHIGDILDHHAISFHDSEPLLKSATGEYEDAREHLQEWYDKVPDLTIMKANHDSLPARRLAKIGMAPEIWLKGGLAHIYDWPEGWKMEDELVIDDCLVHHGESANGVNGFRNDSIKRMCSTATGHNHSNAGVSWTASKSKAIFGLATGCGVDVKSLAMAYGKNFANKPMIACGVLIDGHPYSEVMDRGRKPW